MEAKEKRAIAARTLNIGLGEMVQMKEKAPGAKSRRGEQNPVKSLRMKLEISRKISSPNADEMTSSDTLRVGIC